MIDRGDPNPIPESTDWGLFPMLLDSPPTGLPPGPVTEVTPPGPVNGMVFPFPVAIGPEPEILRCGSVKKLRRYFSKVVVRINSGRFLALEKEA